MRGGWHCAYYGKEANERGQRDENMPLYVSRLNLMLGLVTAWHWLGEVCRKVPINCFIFKEHTESVHDILFQLSQDSLAITQCPIERDNPLRIERIERIELYEPTATAS